jgi:hypothetical protein
MFFGTLLRESSDIDLIIAPNDLPKAIETLKKHGYSPLSCEYYEWVGYSTLFNFIKILVLIT